MRHRTVATTATALLALPALVGVAAAQPDGVPPEFVLEDRLTVFVVSLLVGGLAIHLGARLFGVGQGYAEAVLAALLGAVAWALVSWVPFVGTLLGLIAWIAVLKWRYPVGWLRAALIGVAAWVVAVVVLAALSLIDVVRLDALGVPGT